MKTTQTQKLNLSLKVNLRSLMLAITIAEVIITKVQIGTTKVKVQPVSISTDLTISQSHVLNQKKQRFGLVI